MTWKAVIYGSGAGKLTATSMGLSYKGTKDYRTGFPLMGLTGCEMRFFTAHVLTTSNNWGNNWGTKGLHGHILSTNRSPSAITGPVLIHTIQFVIFGLGIVPWVEGPVIWFDTLLTVPATLIGGVSLISKRHYTKRINEVNGNFV